MTIVQPKLTHRAWLALLTAFLLVVTSVAVSPKPAAASNTTYYVNNQSGSGCSDSGSGTSTQPFCSFTPINNIGTFGAGDQILLARGATFNQQMVVTGAGNSGNWITIGAYGSGARPKIIRNGSESDRGIRLINPDYWRIQDLEVGYAGAGILVTFLTSGHQGLEFKNLYFHHISGIHGQSGSGNQTTGDSISASAGIDITASNSRSEDPWNGPVINNMLFDNIEGAHNQDTLAIDFLGGGFTYVGPGVLRHDAATNVIMNHLYIHDHDANGMGSYCGDSMALNGVKNLTLMNSIFDEAGACASPSGTAAIYTGFIYDSNFFNNLMINMPNTGSPDQVGIDYEHSANGLHVNNNYFGNNAGWGPSILAFNSYIGSVIPNQLFNLEINGNVMKGNGGGSVRISGSGVTPTGSIQNNLSSDSPFIYTDTGGTSSGMTVSNNKTLSSSDIYHAGYQFSGTQGGSNWSYQSYNGSSWSNLAYYDSVAKAWQTNSSTAVPNVKQFDQTPGTSGKIARAWTAPSSGTISIRGRVLKSDVSGGDGITTRITKNGTRIWPSGGDQSIGYNDLVGAEQALDSVSVSAGDVIRFEVDGSGNNTADAASWAPAIAYTAFGGGGSLPSTPTGLSASGGNGQVALGWSAASGATSYNVKRSTSSGGSFSNVATGVTSTSYTDTGVTNGTTYYYVVSAVNSVGESGNSGQSSATPSSSGTSYAAEWNFDTASNFEGWSMANDVTGTVSGGSLHVAMTGGDPYIISPNNIGVSAANNHIYVRAQNNTSSTSMQIYFQNTGDGGFTEAHSKTFSINANSGYTTYDVDMTGVSGWTGTIKQLRVDAFSGSSSIDFDSIKIGGSGGGGTVPSAPTGLTATGGNAQASLSWSAVSGATSYNVKRSTTSGGSYTNVATGVTSTSYTNTGLTNGTAYYYVVSAVNSAGESANSSQASATPSSGSSYAAEWNFDTASNFEGWAMQNDVSGTVSGGSLHVSMTGGSDPYILSPGGIGVSASNGHLYLRLQNNTSSTNLQVYFQNTGDSGFTEAHSKTFSINANSGYTTYDIDMSSVSGWSGTIKQLRIDEYSTSGSIDFDSIKIGN